LRPTTLDASRTPLTAAAMSRRLALWLLLSAAPAFAEAPPRDEWRRELGGHVFVPSLAVADPFLSTFFSLDAGAGYSWIDGPGYDLRGNLVGKNNYVAEALALDGTFQASVTSWLAVRAAGSGGLNGGSDGRSALVVGAVEPITLGAGLTASWRLARVVRVGGTFDFSYTHLKLVQPVEAVRSSLAVGQVDNGAISQRIDAYAVQPGAAVAYAPHPMIGLLGSAQYLWRGYFGDAPGVNRSYIVLGVGAELDLRPRFPRVPVGFLLAYRTQIPFESEARFTHTLEGGVFYTGRRAIDLGVDLQLRWFDLRPDARIPLDTLQLVSVFLLRYHWN